MVTLEPCAMCAMAAVWARIDRIIFGAAEEGSSQAAAADIATGISVTGVDDLGLSVDVFDVLVDATDGAGI